MNFTRRGFSLIEILVVIAAVGILSTSAINVYQSLVYSKRVSTTKSEMDNIAKALRMYWKDTGMLPSTESGLSALLYDADKLGKDLWHGPYISGQNITDSFGNAYFYRPFYSEQLGVKAVILSPGRDGKISEDNYNFFDFTADKKNPAVKNAYPFEVADDDIIKNVLIRAADNATNALDNTAMTLNNAIDSILRFVQRNNNVLSLSKGSSIAGDFFDQWGIDLVYVSCYSVSHEFGLDKAFVISFGPNGYKDSNYFNICQQISDGREDNLTRPETYYNVAASLNPDEEAGLKDDNINDDIWASIPNYEGKITFNETVEPNQENNQKEEMLVCYKGNEITVNADSAWAYFYDGGYLGHCDIKVDEETIKDWHKSETDAESGGHEVGYEGEHYDADKEIVVCHHDKQHDEWYNISKKRSEISDDEYEGICKEQSEKDDDEHHEDDEESGKDNESHEREEHQDGQPPRRAQG